MGPIAPKSSSLAVTTTYLTNTAHERHISMIPLLKLCKLIQVVQIYLDDVPLV